MAIAGRILPIMPTVERSFRLARERAPAIKLPLILLACLFALRFLLQPRIIPGQMPSMSGLSLHFVFAIAIGIAAIGFVVGTHRMILRGELLTGPDYFRFDGATLRYIGYVGLLGIAITASFFAVGLIAAAIGRIAILLFLVLFAAVFVIGVRVSVFFPAVAIGDPAASLTRAWNETRGNGLRLAGGALLIGVPFGLVGGILAGIFWDAGFIGKVIGAALIGPVYAAVTLIGTIFLSLAYEQLSQDGDATIIRTGPAPLGSP